MSEFDVFAGPPDAVQGAPERQAQRDALVAALAHPAGRAWLDAMLAAEYARPSYVPGDTFDAAAWREGRKALLREIAEQMHRATNPTPTSPGA